MHLMYGLAECNSETKYLYVNRFPNKHLPDEMNLMNRMFEINKIGKYPKDIKEDGYFEFEGKQLHVTAI